MNKYILVAVIAAVIGAGFYSYGMGPTSHNVAQADINVAEKTFGPGDGPILSKEDQSKIESKMALMEFVDDIAHDPTDIPPPIQRNSPAVVKVELEAKEVVAEIAEGITYNYWTYDGTVPGPMIRVREGDSVELTLKNNSSSVFTHNIDLHAVTGPGGGAKATNVAPGESITFEFKALHPGLYVYHCAHPNAAAHMTNGMYGLILVEPEAGLLKVDHEFYVMQGELYTKGVIGEQGYQAFSGAKMLQESPEYVVFNGRVGALNDKMQAETGETVRMFVGNGGVSLVSSFHVIGEVFDRVYDEGSLSSDPLLDVQTTIVPAGGANIVEFDLQVPGDYILVDHALSRLDRGAWGVLKVLGEPTDEGIYTSEGKEHNHTDHSH